MPIQGPIQQSGHVRNVFSAMYLAGSKGVCADIYMVGSNFFHRSISIKSSIGCIPYTGLNDILNVSQDFHVNGFHVQALADDSGFGLLADLFRKPTY